MRQVLAILLLSIWAISATARPLERKQPADKQQQAEVHVSDSKKIQQEIAATLDTLYELKSLPYYERTILKDSIIRHLSRHIAELDTDILNNLLSKAEKWKISKEFTALADSLKAYKKHHLLIAEVDTALNRPYNNDMRQKLKNKLNELKKHIAADEWNYIYKSHYKYIHNYYYAQTHFSRYIAAVDSLRAIKGVASDSALYALKAEQMKDNNFYCVAEVPYLKKKYDNYFPAEQEIGLLTDSIEENTDSIAQAKDTTLQMRLELLRDSINEFRNRHMEYVNKTCGPVRKYLEHGFLDFSKDSIDLYNRLLALDIEDSVMKQFCDSVAAISRKAEDVIKARQTFYDNPQLTNYELMQQEMSEIDCNDVQKKQINDSILQPIIKYPAAVEAFQNIITKLNETIEIKSKRNTFAKGNLNKLQIENLINLGRRFVSEVYFVSDEVKTAEKDMDTLPWLKKMFLQYKSRIKDNPLNPTQDIETTILTLKIR